MFKKGDEVTWTISILGSDSKSQRIVSKVTKKFIELEGEPGIKFDPDTGQEIRPVFTGCSSAIKLRKRK